MTASWDDEYLTVGEIAEHLKLNQQTVRNWIDQGRLPAVRIGRRVRVRRVDLERILAQGTTATEAGGSPAETPSAGRDDPVSSLVGSSGSVDAREQLASALEGARRLLGRRSAVRRAELAEGLQALADSVAVALHALSDETNGPPDTGG